MAGVSPHEHAEASRSRDNDPWRKGWRKGCQERQLAPRRCATVRGRLDRSGDEAFHERRSDARHEAFVERNANSFYPFQNVFQRWRGSHRRQEISGGIPASLPRDILKESGGIGQVLELKLERPNCRSNGRPQGKLDVVVRIKEKLSESYYPSQAPYADRAYPGHSPYDDCDYAGYQPYANTSEGYPYQTPPVTPLNMSEPSLELLKKRLAKVHTTLKTL
eukprot:TRINITY_DN2065_c0_g1_i8.p1 TRINITY_DN2065_c0_g1~~TRINITY_DN2065_c0_g1_i8.p1  ORF type:complete len:220 (+),score=-1.47 TRINITY_DN2065_c0_g1_i8:256-915(+)